MTDNLGEPHSIWLCPSTATSDGLRQMITQIATAQNAPAFEPHLTFLGDLTGPIATTLNACRSAFPTLAPIQGKIGQISRSEKFFMAFYLNIEVPAALSVLRRTISTTLTGTAPAPFTPHVSLAYGDLPVPFDQTAYQNQADALTKQGILFDHIAIVRSAKSIPIEQWEITAKINLTG